jgi:hypothetical protein
VGTETLTVASGTGTVPSKNAGAAQTLALGTLALGDGANGGLASNYTLSGGTHTGTISPRPITVSATSDTKTYDGTTASGAAPTIAGGLGAGDTAAFLQTFDTKNVGTGKTLTPSGTVNDGNGGANYTVTFAAANTGTINPATLTYVADPASRNAGDPNPPFTGTVTGFVAGETLATATTGTLAFASPATVTSPAGQYPIDGSGLTANNGNYLFVQAPGNATALTVLTISNAAAQSALQTTVNESNNAAPSTTIGAGTGPQDQALSSSQAFLQTGSGETILLTSAPSAQGGVYVNLETGQEVVITPTDTPAPGIYYNEQTSTVVAVAKDDSGKTVVLTGTASSDTVAKGGKPRLVSSVGCK